MNIPPKYEDVVVKLGAALGREAEVCRLYDSLVNRSNREREASERREAALREELTTAKRAVPHTAGGGISQREFDYDRGFSAGSAEVETFRLERDALQQRLTVSEQRVDLLEGLLKSGSSPTYAHCSAVMEALKPAAEGEGS